MRNSNWIQNRIDLLTQMQKDEKNGKKESRKTYTDIFGVGPRFLTACEKYGVLQTSRGYWTLQKLQVPPSKALVERIIDIEHAITLTWKSYKDLPKSKEFLDSASKAYLEKVVKVDKKNMEIEHCCEKKDKVIRRHLNEEITNSNVSSVNLMNSKIKSVFGLVPIGKVITILELAADKTPLQEIIKKSGVDSSGVMNTITAIADIIDIKYVEKEFINLMGFSWWEEED